MLSLLYVLKPSHYIPTCKEILSNIELFSDFIKYRFFSNKVLLAKIKYSLLTSATHFYMSNILGLWRTHSRTICISSLPIQWLQLGLYASPWVHPCAVFDGEHHWVWKSSSQTEDLWKYRYTWRRFWRYASGSCLWGKKFHIIECLLRYKIPQEFMISLWFVEWNIA